MLDACTRAMHFAQRSEMYDGSDVEGSENKQVDDAAPASLSRDWPAINKVGVGGSRLRA